MTNSTTYTTGTITANKRALQLYLGVQFSRSPRNPLRGAEGFEAFSDPRAGVIVVFPADHDLEFPLEVRPPDDAPYDCDRPAPNPDP